MSQWFPQWIDKQRARFQGSQCLVLPGVWGHNQPSSILTKSLVTLTPSFHVYFTVNIHYSVEGKCNLYLILCRDLACCSQTYPLKRLFTINLYGKWYFGVYYCVCHTFPGGVRVWEQAGPRIISTMHTLRREVSVLPGERGLMAGQDPRAPISLEPVVFLGW